MKGNHEHYSTGPFSRVWFVYDNEGKLDTFTYRHHALQPSGTLVNTGAMNIAAKTTLANSGLFSNTGTVNSSTTALNITTGASR